MGFPANLSYERIKLHFWHLQKEFNNTAFHTKQVFGQILDRYQLQPSVQ